jgi:hypothetical protein
MLMGNERPEARHNSNATKVTLEWIVDEIKAWLLKKLLPSKAAKIKSR